MRDMWEERYAADEYAYGEEPNAFFKACLDRLPAPFLEDGSPCSREADTVSASVVRVAFPRRELERFETLLIWFTCELWAAP